MLTKPCRGWTEVFINNERLGFASYMRWVPGDVLDSCIRYLKECKKSMEKYNYIEGGYGFNVEFDGEDKGYFGIVEIGSDFFTFDTYQVKEPPYVKLKEIDLKEYDYDDYKFVYNLTKEVIEDIESNYEDWVLWDVMTFDKEEYQEKKYELDKILREAKELVKELKDDINNSNTMELGNLLFGNSRGEFPILDREIWQDTFCEFLEDCGFDSYGHIDNEKLEKNLQTVYGDTIKRTGEEDYVEHQHYFENDVFRIMPYWWGESKKIAAMPNFIYKPTGFEIQWYKYPMRDAYKNKDISFEDFCNILNKCKDSLRERK